MSNHIKELSVKSTHYIIAGFSVVVGLTWKDTINNIINTYFPLQDDAIVVQIIYALALTLALVIIVNYLPDTTTELPTNIQAKVNGFKNYDN